MGAAVGLPAASLCINRRLYQIANVQAVTIGRAEVSLQHFPSLVRNLTLFHRNLGLSSLTPSFAFFFL